jgi:hypothetical protein
VRSARPSDGAEQPRVHGAAVVKREATGDERGEDAPSAVKGRKREARRAKLDDSTAERQHVDHPAAREVPPLHQSRVCPQRNEVSRSSARVGHVPNRSADESLGLRHVRRYEGRERDELIPQRSQRLCDEKASPPRSREQDGVDHHG